MPRVPFADLPDDSRLWVFPLSRSLTAEEESAVLARVDAFLGDWAAHGEPLTTGRDWTEGRFLHVAVDEATVPPSGCSIDNMARVLKEMGAELGMEFLDHSPIWFRQDGALQRVDRKTFREMVEEGVVGLDTPVFDNSITRLSQLRKGEWERPAGASWHRRAFFPNRDG